MSVPLVIFHASCADGMTAAWVMRAVHSDAKFLPVSYGEEPPEVIGLDVIVVDFSFKREILLSMKEKAKSLLVLDHHKTAQVDLAGLPFCRFDMHKSGARLTWEYFFPGYPAPWLVAYTEDRDLWTHRLPGTKEINAVIRSYPLSFETWDRLDKLDPEDLIPEGSAILRYRQQLIDAAVSQAGEIEMDGYKVLAVNCSCGEIVSEVAGELAKDRRFGVTWFETAKGQRVYSLRSRENAVDVSEIAKRHGGGGHRNAAGFQVPNEQPK